LTNFITVWSASPIHATQRAEVLETNTWSRYVQSLSLTIRTLVCQNMLHYKKRLCTGYRYRLLLWTSLYILRFYVVFFLSNSAVNTNEWMNEWTNELPGLLNIFQFHFLQTLSRLTLSYLQLRYWQRSEDILKLNFY
jgi:hypothetical protein